MTVQNSALNWLQPDEWYRMEFTFKVPEEMSPDEILLGLDFGGIVIEDVLVAAI